MKELILTIAGFITLTTTTSFANTTKCDHRGNAGLFANTNPPVAKATAKTKTTSSSSAPQSGVR